jgi:DNA-binding SARP family transcriptional activator
VARGTQHRKRRPAANARVATAPGGSKAKPKAKAKGVRHQRWEDQLFFARLRLHAKWVFAFLALVFAGTFIFLGVGSGSTGIGDALQSLLNGNSSGGGSSESSLRKAAQQHPQQPKAWHDLATKLEADSKFDDAIVALKHYVALRPNDQTVLEELAGVYLRRAQDEQQAYVDAQSRSQFLSPQSVGQPPSSSSLGKALSSVTNPIQSAVSTDVGTQSSDAYTSLVKFEAAAVGVYKKLAKLSPKDSITQLRLAQVAEGSGDSATAIAAYKKFLQLAPSDPSAPTARKALKQLEKQQSTATPSTTKK